MHRYWIAAALIALISGCTSTVGQSTDPTPTLFVIPTLSPTQMLTQPAQATEPADASPTAIVEETSADVLDVGNLGTDALSSYRSTFTMIWSGTDENGQSIDGSYLVESDFNRDPHARRVWWSSSATTVPNATFELYEVGDDAWTIIGDASDQLCLSGSREELGNQDAPYTPEYWLTNGDLSGLRRLLPDAEINGVLAQHYQMTEAEQATFAGYSDYTLDVWVAAEGGYVVRQSLIAEGVFADFATGSGHVEWTFDLLEANQPVTITAPTCEGE